MAPELVAELATAIEARVLDMDHYVHPDNRGQSRYKGDHLHLCAKMTLSSYCDSVSWTVAA